ncbi:MAG: hypothetical protein JRH18_20740 [Deltaproteobacteria bacterium]|nr:hypothetical protein [Deltaproteobacteria bacterium]MBW2154080.1 hypothetical protein [Deltaproteobacteria bacterium]
MWQSDSGAVGYQQSESVPGFRFEVVFKESVESLVELDEGLIFKFHSILCECGLGYKALRDVSAFEDIEKPIQFILI